MDKRKIFQIQNIEAKKKDIQNNLNNLLNEKEKLNQELNKISPEQTQELQNLLNILNNNKTTLLSKYENTKTIIKNKNQLYSQLNQEIKSIPINLKNEIETEKQIMENEIARIIEKNIDTNNEQLESIYSLYSDKDNLLQTCNDLQQQINLYSNELNNIQIDEHTKRKTTLQHLQQLKKLKKNNQNISQKITENKNYINETITNLNTQIELLKKTKYNIIEVLYERLDEKSIDYEYIKQITGLNLLDSDTLNEKIKLLDRQLMILEYNIEKENKNYKIASNINDPLDEFKNSFNCKKLIPFKTKYKEQKEIISNLEKLLNEKQQQHSNFDDTIIKDNIEKYLKIHEKLIEEYDRAISRFNIMNSRINSKYEKKNTELNNSLDQVKNELIELNNNLQDLNINIEKNTKDIELHGVVIGKLNDINSRIKLFEDNLKQIDSDLEKLRSI